jgi:DNA modification methylase
MLPSEKGAPKVAPEQGLPAAASAGSGGNGRNDGLAIAASMPGISPACEDRPMGSAEEAADPLRERAPLRLHWPGRVWEPRTAGQARVSKPKSAAKGGRLAPTELFGELEAPSGRLVRGDALDVAAALAGEGLLGQVDLVYVDPPFASQAEYVHEARLDGPADGRVVRARAYDDRWEGDGIGGYLDMMAPRLEALAALLAPSGTIWVHVDWRASYLVRLVLDEVLGRGAFVNEIVWRRAPNLGRQAASRQFGRTLDTLIVYGREDAKLTPPTRLEPIDSAAVRFDDQGRPFTTAPRGDYTDESIARLDAEGRVHRTASGRVYVKYFLQAMRDGSYSRERRVDALWTDVPPLRHAATTERTGYPTQKPRALLDRVVACASPPGGLVVDLFGGSGTTGESAHALGRRFVVGDASALAIGTARARLLRAGAAFAVEGFAGASSAGGDPSRVEVRVAPRGEHLAVELESPREPLAWAIDVAHDASGPFRTAWHSERAPGARVRAVKREALVPRTPGRLAVRVWEDDGAVVTRVVEGGVP